MFNTKTIGYVDPYQLGQQLNTSIATYLNQSVAVTGFNRSSRAYVPAGAAYPDTTIQVQPNI